MANPKKENALTTLEAAIRIYICISSGIYPRSATRGNQKRQPTFVPDICIGSDQTEDRAPWENCPTTRRTATAPQRWNV